MSRLQAKEALMIFADWPTLFDELKIEVLNHIFTNQNSSNSLFAISNFAITSKSYNAIIGNLPIWQQFLSQYFPIIQKSRINHHDEFKKHYLQCEKVLQNFGANFSSYRLALADHWDQIPAAQKEAILSLLLA